MSYTCISETGKQAIREFIARYHYQNQVFWNDWAPGSMTKKNGRARDVHSPPNEREILTSSVGFIGICVVPMQSHTIPHLPRPAVLQISERKMADFLHAKNSNKPKTMTMDTPSFIGIPATGCGATPQVRCASYSSHSHSYSHRSITAQASANQDKNRRHNKKQQHQASSVNKKTALQGQKKDSRGDASRSTLKSRNVNAVESSPLGTASPLRDHSINNNNSNNRDDDDDHDDNGNDDFFKALGIGADFQGERDILAFEESNVDITDSTLWESWSESENGPSTTDEEEVEHVQRRETSALPHEGEGEGEEAEMEHGAKKTTDVLPMSVGPMLKNRYPRTPSPSMEKYSAVSNLQPLSSIFEATDRFLTSTPSQTPSRSPAIADTFVAVFVFQSVFSNYLELELMAWTRTLKEFNLPPPTIQELVAAENLMDYAKPFLTMDWTHRKEIAFRKQEIFGDLLSEFRFKLIPGATEFLMMLKRYNIKTCICCSKYILEKANTPYLFDSVIDAESLEHALYLASDQHQQQCLVFVNKPSDITVAHDVGCKVIGMVQHYPAYALKEADEVAPDYESFSLLNLRRMFRNN